ncbi:uncharacterized protein SPAPADRAFT_130716 [Spathaspora passalidarum NRRL Y-27907]|uniref:Uncharacterized protein n=1 Tax=Spathaspora passalidarum (strain NRRL Y-27907 / 11-Y1) TaxID=619300 RepID=G3AGU8_SPAPN|nr:uncharacterized protein SPAPADRAFT_130716 [Spathaspora passalidarum NRRL Y-27907]EGW35431.1 hypothetical protein SPAPADRAFT_130716 [Spathaspora passalidarum NRRL Y-27907]
MANPQEEVYKQYLNYDWDSFDEFQQGLSEILDNHLETLKEQDPSITSIPALDKQQLTNQAKVFFFCNKTGEILNLEDYEDWKLHNGDKYIKSKQVEEVQEDSSAPYTSNYQNVVELIMSGKPVPGIKQIPDTVLSGQGSTASQSQRAKPWEKN